MKKENPKTFKELFANTGIEPTTDESGNMHYNFKATMKETIEEKLMSIPTAVEFVLNHYDGYLAGDYTPNEVYHIMIGFAKMHVEAALKAASENAIAKNNFSDYGTGDTWVDEKSILNAYPLNNIK
jgi:hypothetical protein